MRGQIISIIFLFLFSFLSVSINGQIQNDNKAAGELSYEMGRVISMLSSISNMKKKDGLFYFDETIQSMEYERLAKLKYLERCEKYEKRINELSASVRGKVSEKMKTIKSFQSAFEQFIVFQFGNQPEGKDELCNIMHLIITNEDLLGKCK